jgi:hypothetical protein
MENNSWSSIQGSGSAPFINGLLTDAEASYATQYYDNPPGHHPSEPNYVWLEAATDTFSDAKYPFAFFPTATRPRPTALRRPRTLRRS